MRLVLLVTMPEMDRYEALARIRARDANVPIFLTSGFSEQHAARNAGCDRFTDFLQKPDLTELDRAVRAALDLGA